jgi:hypothetical protein
MDDWRAVAPALRQGWQPLNRIEDTGGNVATAIQALQDGTGRLVYAEGDSWFDKYTPLGLEGSNLLAQLRLPFGADLVDASLIGDTIENMVSGQEGRQTQAMFEVFDFDVILLSAGGNDLIAIFQMLFAAKASGQVPPGAPFTLADLDHLDDPASYRGFFNTVLRNVAAFVAMRDHARRDKTRKAPIFLHGYDYMQPRPAAAYVFGTQFIGRGPWLYPLMKAAGLDDAQMRSAADAVLDEYNTRLQAEIAAPGSNVFLVDQRGLLTPAAAGSQGSSNDWLDEIHPNAGGFDKLARQRWDVLLAQALGWQPGPNDTVPADPPSNRSTAQADAPAVA